MTVRGEEANRGIIGTILPDAVRLFERDSAKGRLAHTYAHTQQFERLIESGIEDLYERPASEALPHIRSLTAPRNYFRSYPSREFILSAWESIADCAVERIWNVYGHRASGRDYFGQALSCRAVLFVLHDIFRFDLASLVRPLKTRYEDIERSVLDNFQKRPWSRAMRPDPDVELRLMVMYGVTARDLLDVRFENLTMSLKEYVSAIAFVFKAC